MYIKTDAYEQLSTLKSSHGEEEGSGTRFKPARQFPVPSTIGRTPGQLPPQRHRVSQLSRLGLPPVRVCLVQSMRLLPHQDASVGVRLDLGTRLQELEPVLLEPSPSDSLLQVGDSLLRFDEEGLAPKLLS